MGVRSYIEDRLTKARRRERLLPATIPHGAPLAFHDIMQAEKVLLSQSCCLTAYY
jgi:hypothetical protein